MGKLEGRIAIITGAASGIGRAIAIEFAREGAISVLADIDDERGKETESLICSEIGQALFIQTDVRSPKSVESMADEVYRKYGRIDILCNNTGDAVEARKKIRIADLSDKEWDDTFSLGLKSIHNTARAVIPRMVESGGGSILNISSIAGWYPAFSAAFSSMKAGVIAITRSIAIQYADDNIRCNSICPGAIETPGGIAAKKQGLFSDSDLYRVRLIQRLGRPEEIARPAVFLVSDDASYITGAMLPVDGGMLNLVPHIPERDGKNSIEANHTEPKRRKHNGKTGK